MSDEKQQFQESVKTLQRPVVNRSANGHRPIATQAGTERVVTGNLKRSLGSMLYIPSGLITNLFSLRRLMNKRKNRQRQQPLSKRL